VIVGAAYVAAYVAVARVGLKVGAVGVATRVAHGIGRITFKRAYTPAVAKFPSFADNAAAAAVVRARVGVDARSAAACEALWAFAYAEHARGKGIAPVIALAAVAPVYPGVDTLPVAFHVRGRTDARAAPALLQDITHDAAAAAVEPVRLGIDAKLTAGNLAGRAMRSIMGYCIFGKLPLGLQRAGAEQEKEKSRNGSI